MDVREIEGAGDSVVRLMTRLEGGWCHDLDAALRELQATDDAESDALPTRTPRADRLQEDDDRGYTPSSTQTEPENS